MTETPNKRALVTGGARGIGRAICETLVPLGWEVTAVDIDEAAVACASESWSDKGLNIRTAELDVTSRSAVSAFFNAEEPFTLVVNNAGIAAELLPFAEIDRHSFSRMLRVNVAGSFIIAQEAAKRMSQGTIINIASRGYLGGAGAAHYVASKAAIVGMTRAMAIELRWRDISVNAIAPGMIDTRMLDGFSQEMRSKLGELEPSGGPSDPSVIADAVVYLASKGGRALNGQVFLIDGGKALGIAPY